MSLLIYGHIGGELSKVGGRLRQLADLRGRLAKKMGMVFLRGVDTPIHTMGKVGIWEILRNGWISVIGGLIPLSCEADQFLLIVKLTLAPYIEVGSSFFTGTL